VRILVVEDSEKMATLIRRGFEEEGFAVDVAGDADEAIWFAQENPYDAIALDIALGSASADGLEVCRGLREGGCWSPVLMLTARDAVEDRVRGLDVGADDYLTKPFSFDELLARIRALIRRSAQPRPTILAVGDLSLDPAQHQVRRGDHPIELTSKEFALLEFFMRHAGDVLSRSTLTEHVWDFAHEGDSNLIDVHVRNLRMKIDRSFERSSLETVRRVGYRIRDDTLDDAPA
jgi:two-component system OmpR family response regulator